MSSNVTLIREAIENRLAIEVFRRLLQNSSYPDISTCRLLSQAQKNKREKRSKKFLLVSTRSISVQVPFSPLFSDCDSNLWQITG
ncbi:hypothetical protein Gasu2_57910 [Galdieria sulphuraria]|nr:hypothetical protein Gasu2_57910 [Galdieria sulphuraria]